MLRYFYLLSLLIIIDIGFCYEYLRESEPKRLCHRKIRDNINPRHRKRIVEERQFRKRRDYDSDYDKDSMAQIDVANFIKSPDDQIDESDTYGNHISKLNNYNDYGNLLDKDINGVMNINEDYSDIDSENVQDYTEIDHKFTEKEKNNKPRREFDNIFKNKFHSDLGSQISRHYQAKKCALKNFKLPFFSHEKSTTTKAAKEKKRKAQFSHKLHKENDLTEENNENMERQHIAHTKQSLYLNKRSYIEKICPICKRKFIFNKQKVKNNLNTRHSSDDRNIEIGSVTKNSPNENTIDNNNGDNNLDMSYISKEIDFEAPVRDRRRKREDDNRNIERQKELEDLEKRVESVSIISPSFNKADKKS